MHPLEKRVGKTISDAALLRRGDRAVVAVSAGPDSMALLHALASLSGELGISLVASYVDHGLRPGETGREAALVEEQAALLRIPFKTGKIAVREYARGQRLSLEHAARILRYRMLEEIASESGAARIAVAHTADDQAEELLLRLLRGTGRKGLSGMAFRVAGRIIRPFLEISKEEILNYLRDRELPYLIDSSNLSPVYLRNRVRLELLPCLEERYNPNLKETLRQTARILQDEEEILEQLTLAACERVLVEGSQGGAAGLVALRLEAFALEPRAIQRRILEAVCWRTACPPSFRSITNLLELALRGRTGDRLHLARGLRVNRQEGRMIFSYPAGKVARRGDPTGGASFAAVIDGPGSYPIPALGKRVIVTVSAGVPPREHLRAREADYLDGGTVSFPLQIRSPRAGDRFHPLGAPGRKKVSDFLADRKIPAALRWQVPVLEDGRGIAALLGLRIDETRKISGRTEQTVAFRLEPL